MDPITLNCPGVTEPCSLNTSPENTICKHPDEKASCPLTFISIILKDEITQYLPNKPSSSIKYEISDFSDTHAVVFSKDVDSLPIT